MNKHIVKLIEPNGSHITMLKRKVSFRYIVAHLELNLKLDESFQTNLYVRAKPALGRPPSKSKIWNFGIVKRLQIWRNRPKKQILKYVGKH